MKLTASAAMIVRRARFQPVSTAAVQRPPVADLVTDALEVDDEQSAVTPIATMRPVTPASVRRKPMRRAEDRDREVGQGAGHDERGDGDQAEGAVLEERVDDDEEQADRSGEQAEAQLLVTELGR